MIITGMLAVMNYDKRQTLYQQNSLLDLGKWLNISLLIRVKDKRVSL